MVTGATVTYKCSLETNLDAMEVLFKEVGYEVLTLSTYADRWVSQRRARFYVVCVHKDKFAAVHGGSIALTSVMKDLKSIWLDRFSKITVHADYALRMKDLLLPDAHPLVQAHLLQLERASFAHKKRRLSESAPADVSEADQDDKIKWHKHHIDHYKNIGLEYRPEHENPYRFLYTDSLFYGSRPTREREIILAEDEKNQIGFSGSEAERSLDECTLVLSHRVSRRK